MAGSYNDNFALVRGQITAQSRQNVVTAAVYLVGQIKLKLGTGNRTGKVYMVPGTKGRQYTSSAPGEAPAVMLASLISSISHQIVTDTPEEVVVQVGTVIEYAARLEFGYFDVDSIGRRYDMPARPFMRSTYIEQREKIKAIMGGETP